MPLMWQKHAFDVAKTCLWGLELLLAVRTRRLLKRV